MTPRGKLLATCVVVVMSALVGIRDFWPVRLLLVAALLLGPGLLLLCALRVPISAVARMVVYVPCASLAVLYCAGLAVNLGAPLLAVAEPLRPLPLTAGLAATCFVLIACCRNESRSSLRRLRLVVPWSWSLILPVLSAAGAARLTNGAGAFTAVLAVVVGLIALALVVVCAPRWGSARCAVVVYAVGFASLLGYSLRGDLVYGFDIAAEYGIARAVEEHGIWMVDHAGDAYGAMLSTSVLPALLHSVTGLPLTSVLSVLYPALFAFFPVAVFGLTRRLLPVRWAAAAAAFVLVQQNFAQQMPALARQEVALLLFVAVIAAALDAELPRSRRFALVTIFSLAIVVSHYSTAYLLVGVAGTAVLVQWVLGRLRGGTRHTAGVLVALVVTAVGALLWYGPITRSGDNLLRFGDSIAAQGLDVLPNRAPGESWLDTYLHAATTRKTTAGRYGDEAARIYAGERPYVVPFADADDYRYALVDSSPAETPRLPVGTWLETTKLVLQQLANLLIVAGAVAMAMRRRAAPIVRAVSALAVATLLVLLAVRFSGTASVAYNQERALLQALVVLAVPLAWVGARAAMSRWFSHAATGVTVAVITVLGITGSGLTAVMFGGTVPAGLSGRGEDVERFVMTAGELEAARWLGPKVRAGELVYADRYGQLRLLAATGVAEGLMLDITPRTLDRHGWVYATTANTKRYRARGVADGWYASYEFPHRFLEEHYNKVYTNGQAEVFRR